MYAHLWPGDEDRIRQAVDAHLARCAEDCMVSQVSSFPGQRSCETPSHKFMDKCT